MSVRHKISDLIPTAHNSQLSAGKKLGFEKKSSNNPISWRLHGGRCSVGRVGYGPPKILVGLATMHLAPPMIGLYVH